MSGATRTSQQTLHRLENRLSERDLDVLRSISRFRLMQISHLERLHFADHASPQTAGRICRRVLKRLHDHRLVGRLERRIGGEHAGSAGHIYAVAPLGHRLLGSANRKRWHEPHLAHVNHTLAATELSVQLTTIAPEAGLDLLELQPEPEAWRTYSRGHGALTLKPDLAVVVADDETELAWFIEIDLATESRPVLARKCEAYIDYWRTGTEQQRNGVFPKVLWVVPNERRASAIRSVVERLDSEQAPELFDVVTTERAAEHLTSFRSLASSEAEAEK